MDSVPSTIVMLAVAFAAGLIGGIGAAVIEARKRCSDGEKSGNCSPWWSAVGCVVLGGIAAVVALYFFPPTEVKVPDPTKPEDTETFYSLTKLVALSLLVGTGGTAVLQSLQGRFTAQLEVERTNGQKQATEATAAQALTSVAPAAQVTATEKIEQAASRIEAELQKEQALSPKDAKELVGKLADDASKAIAAHLEKQADAAKEAVAAAAAGEPASES